MGYCSKCFDKYGDIFYLLFRAIAGLMFFMHGYMKFSGGAPKGVMLVAGTLELLVGAALFLGFFTRLAAIGGIVVMVGALFRVHFPQGLNPLANGGELAVLYLLAFLVMLKLGNGMWSLEKKLLKKETF